MIERYMAYYESDRANSSYQTPKTAFIPGDNYLSRPYVSIYIGLSSALTHSKSYTLVLSSRSLHEELISAILFIPDLYGVETAV